MSWDTGAAGGDDWKADAGGGGDSWGGGANASGGRAVDSWGGGGDDGGNGGGDCGDQTCRVCSQTGHFARDCPDKPEGGGMTGECYGCGEVGHNRADCPNPKAEKCRLCSQEGHKALDCKERRIIDWTGVPELSDGEAWTAIIEAATENDLDKFRTSLRAYARAVPDDFSLVAVEQALREAGLGVYLVAKQQEIATNMTIVDLVGQPAREFVLSVQLSARPRRAKMATGWPESPEQNLERLASAGYVHDIGAPLCNNCGELGHTKKRCPQEPVEHESNTPAVQCVYCKEDGHRARDCPKERENPFACKNCKQEGHNSKECPEPRSAEGVECRKCNETGHFSKDCHNVAKRVCRNCDSEDHIAKECPEPKNPAKAVCRNCEETGHFSKECPKPRDYSKVQCQNCQQFGHTRVRCKEPAAKSDAMGDGGAVGGWGDAGGATETTATGGEDSWGGGDAGGGGGW